MSLRAVLRRLLARLLRRRRGDSPALAALAAQIVPLLPPGSDGPLHAPLAPPLLQLTRYRRRLMGVSLPAGTHPFLLLDQAPDQIS